MNGPPIHLHPTFVALPDALLEWLGGAVTWDERMRARKTASFGVPYNYSQIAYETVAMPCELDTLCGQIEAELGFRPNNCLLNHYADGASSMGFHSDSSEALAPGTGVAIVSLGSTRSIAYRSKVDSAVRFDYPLRHGSLLYMSDAVQQNWLHAIPKAEGAGERISLTFRAVLK
ncbi:MULTISPECIES: alpha-ketoglutarate-dependent dioxygenase AlkB family protein [unclassified Variovorax]|uniref:alpha-ketoglutarate-dependent dioxygenase AlkB family protein n=1 Tax=unclassified Variovorax TaxID=663243 RepID=UPI003F479684